MQIHVFLTNYLQEIVCQKNFRISKYTVYNQATFFFKSQNDMGLQKNCYIKKIMVFLSWVNFFVNIF